MNLPKAAEIIAQDLRQQIVSGALREGDHLHSEADLMSVYEVSRPTLREALRILETEGLVVVRRGSPRGARVVAPQASVASRFVGLILQTQRATLGDVYLARMAVEAPLAGLVAARRDPEIAGALRAALREEEEAIADPMSGGKGSPLFHETLARLSGNQTLTLFVLMLHQIVERHESLYVQRVRGDTQAQRLAHGHAAGGYRTHVKLVEHVLDHDVEAANQLWKSHLEALGTIMINATQARDVVDLFT